jgi:hypothetical protein
MTSKKIGLSEASKLEIENTLRKYETRIMIAVEGARRDAIRNGRNEIETIQRDERLHIIFKEAVEASSRAGLGWLALARAFTGIKGSGLESEAGNINSRIQQHCALSRKKADDLFISIVIRLVPGARLRKGAQ